MKFLASILAIYIIVLTISPCCDALISSSVNKVESIQKAADYPHNGIDHCSPFCSCNCCASPILYQTIFFDFNTSFFPTGKFIDLKTEFISTLYASIWQPPEIA